MQVKHNSLPFIFIVLALFFFGCDCPVSCSSDRGAFVVKDFRAPVNMRGAQPIMLDYSEAIDSGFIIPTVRQTPAGGFVFTFSVKNTDHYDRSFLYKIYYQNESYKMPEQDAHNPNSQHPLAEENFYGSWDNTDITFRSTGNIPADGQWHSVTDTFRIAGNPRNEERYYSAVDEEKYAPSGQLRQKRDAILRDSAWSAAVREKAHKAGLSFEEQVTLDASFMVNEDRRQVKVNNRWQRNPRVGTYNLMLVVTTEQGFRKMPEQVANISLRAGGRFTNPFHYFVHGRGSRLSDAKAIILESAIRVKASPDPGAGMYISRRYFKDRAYSKAFYSDRCNEDSLMYQRAAFMQFVHAIDSTVVFGNIPRYMDFTANDYTVKDYVQARKTYSEGDLVKTSLSVTDCPCRNVRSDKERKLITISNRGNKPGEYRKENTGVISRHGFTYGKYTARIKLAELLNKHKVWNGLTNAFWFINQGGDTQAFRRPCEKVGFIPKEYEGRDAPRVRQTAYSEIDFEIRKTSRYWPSHSYHKGDARPVDDRSDSDQVIVTCTNWDLSCWDPPRYDAGVQHLPCNGQDVVLHRWTHWYKALTSKYPAADDELFGGPWYYFQVEWKPNEIIWRIGPSKDRLRVVSYMNDSVTTIPSNQMLMVFTQEYHPSKWWPESQFDQEYIPFLSKDLEGIIYDVEIE